jgi:hypothetical protein
MGKDLMEIRSSGYEPTDRRSTDGRNVWLFPGVNDEMDNEVSFWNSLKPHHHNEKTHEVTFIESGLVVNVWEIAESVRSEGPFLEETFLFTDSPYRLFDGNNDKESFTWYLLSTDPVLSKTEKGILAEETDDSEIIHSNPPNFTVKMHLSRPNDDPVPVFIAVKRQP